MRLTACLCLAAAAALAQQQFTPHIGYVYPAGGRQGASVDVTIGGQFLNGVDQALATGAGLQLQVVEHIRPMTAQQAQNLREQVQELLKAPLAERNTRKIAELREKLATFVRRPASAAIAEMVRLRITIAPDAAPGPRELRLLTPNGVTNPMVFHVGNLPEISKPAMKLTEQPVAGEAVRPNPNPRPLMVVEPTAVTLPAQINGQLGPGGVDRYRFTAVKGQHLVVQAQARELIPYISDAVPGWFQAVVELSDAQGREVASAASFRFHPDPVLHYEIPAGGAYTLAIHDSIYRGREDFVYRIAAGELPFITSVFPLGAKAGQKVNFEIAGWNLPVTRLAENTKGKAAGVYPIAVRKGEWLSNSAPVAVGALNEKLEKEPNDQPRGANAVKLPLIVNGRIGKPGDVDVYRIDGRAGDELVAEVTARRLDSPLDSVLRLTDAKGNQLAVNDDSEDKGSGLLTHHADSVLRCKLPAKGQYYVYLADAQRKGGPEFAYRLRLSQARPDFELRVVPASLTVRAGLAAPITVHAVRKDGFAGDIALKLQGAPAGFALSGAWIPAGQDKVRFTITAPGVPAGRPLTLHLEGRATIQGREAVRAAVPAEDMMQAFYYRHLVPAADWIVRVLGQPRYRDPFKLASDKPARLPAGGAVPVVVSVPRGVPQGMFQMTLSEPPEGISILEIVSTREGVAVVLKADGVKAKPGLKGNLIVDVAVERPQPANAKTKLTAAQRRVMAGTLPAIPFEVVAAETRRATR